LALARGHATELPTRRRGRISSAVERPEPRRPPSNRHGFDTVDPSRVGGQRVRRASHPGKEHWAEARERLSHPFSGSNGGKSPDACVFPPTFPAHVAHKVAQWNSDDVETLGCEGKAPDTAPAPPIDSSGQCARRRASVSKPPRARRRGARVGARTPNGARVREGGSGTAGITYRMTLAGLSGRRVAPVSLPTPSRGCYIKRSGVCLGPSENRRCSHLFGDRHAVELTHRSKPACRTCRMRRSHCARSPKVQLSRGTEL
jgi:hypothetical protein